MPITRTTPTLCPRCGYVLDAHGTAPGEADPAPPRAGDYTICVGCVGVLQFGADGMLRPVTADELAAVDPAVLAVLAEQRALIRRFFPPRPPDRPE